LPNWFITKAYFVQSVIKRHSYCEEQYLEAFKAAESFYVEDGELQITSGKLLLIFAEENSGMLQGLVTIGPINLIS